MVPETDRNIKTLKSSLFDNCESGKTGTVFITTLDNQSCQIILTNGQITAFSFGQMKGADAVLHYERAGFKKASFIDNVQAPLSEDAKIE